MLLDAHGKPVSTKLLKREVAGSDVVGWRQSTRAWRGSFIGVKTDGQKKHHPHATQGDLDQTLTLAEEMEERDLHYRSAL